MWRDGAITRIIHTPYRAAIAGGAARGATDTDRRSRVCAQSDATDSLLFYSVLTLLIGHRFSVAVKGLEIIN